MDKLLTFSGRLACLFFSPTVISVHAAHSLPVSPWSLLRWTELGGSGDTMALGGLAVMFWLCSG